MAYKLADFSGCVFNPLVKGKMLAEYPRLSEIVEPEWTADPQLDFMLRYCALMYDGRSPLTKDEPDMNIRKTNAAMLAGFDLNNDDYMQGIYSFDNKLLLDLTVRFLIRFAKSKEWTTMVVVENCYWENVRKLLKPITDSDDSKAELEAVQKKSVLKTELDNDIARIETYKRKLYGDDKDLETKARPRSRPEDYAKGKIE